MRLHTIHLRLVLFVIIGLYYLLPPNYLQAQAFFPDHVTPPAPYAIPVVQPDGTTLQIIARGNQFQHWSETIDGYTVVKNRAGYYEYAVARNGYLSSSGTLARDPQGRSLAEQRGLLAVRKHAQPAAEAMQVLPVPGHQSSPLHKARTQASAAVPPQGKINLLAICIDYPDQPATYGTNSFFSMFNGPSDKPTFRQYYLNNSYGKLDMTVDVVGWVRAKQNYRNYAYSGGYVASHALVTEAIAGAEEQGVDFSKYDNNNDGKVDGVIIIHAGPGAEEGGREEYIWSHQWAISSVYYDNRFISDYTIQPETRYGGRVGIGIFCHEFGHLLGLPDLYDTDFNDGRSNGIGEWGLMGTGGWLGGEAYPAGMSAWSKETMGWAEAEDITGEYGSYSLKAASQNNAFYKIRTPNPNEYFLLENRQLRGVDSRLNGSGLAIWHIDRERTSIYPASNLVNAKASRKGVDLEEADGKGDLDSYTNRGDQGDLFPGFSGNHSFNHTSRPNANMNTAAGGSTETGVGIENIQEVNGQIAFTYRNDRVGVGEACEEPATAAVGSNRSDQYVSWHEFTIPKDGGISITGKSDGNIAVYTSCNTDPIAQSTTSNLTVGYLSRGQRVLIRWEHADRSGLPISWNLKVENSVAARDSLALVAIYQRTEGARWTKRDNWLRGQVASWEGVKIEDGRVTELQLNQAGLRGRFPAELYQLTGLKKLILREASLTGTISRPLNKLTDLEELVIEGSGLSVDFLSEVDALTKLRVLSLVSVKGGGALPATIGQLSQLEELTLANAQIKGKIPKSLGSNNALTKIDISQNQLTGAVPAPIFDLPKLAYLALNDNQLTSLPSNMLSSAKLRECYLQDNRLEGALPREVSRSADTPLTLILSRNRFTGSVPNAWVDITFDELAINDNQLSGEFPAIGMPRRLDISANQFTKLPPLQKTAPTGELLCRDNQLSFEDLLPNKEYLVCARCQDRYAPQQDILINLDRILTLGTSSTVELPFDQEVVGSQYVWYRQEQEVSRTDDNALAIAAFTEEQAGAYRCNITNEAFPGLTLRVVGISLNYKQKQRQTIEVPTIADKRFGDEPFTLNARSSAGLSLEYQKVEGPVAIEGDQVTIQGAGEVIIDVVNPGNEQFAAAEQRITFTIAKKQSVITVGQIDDKTYGDEPFQLDVSATDDLAVDLTVEAGNVSLDNGLVSIEGVGDVRLRATRDESDDYEAAEPVIIEFTVGRASQSLTFEALADTTFRPDGKIPLLATLSSGLDAQYEVVSGGVVIVDGEAVIKEAGPVTIRASHPGDENHQAVAGVEQSFVINSAEQSLYLERIDDRLTTDGPFSVVASSTSDLPVGFRILRGPATVDSEGIVTTTGEGEVVVEVYQEGNANYNAAEPMQQEFLVLAADKATQTITVKDVPDTVIVGETFALEITVSSGLSPAVQVGGPATISEGVITFNQVGEVTLQVSQPGDDNYNAASTFTKMIVVLITRPTTNPLAQNLVYGSAERVFGEQVEVRALSGLPLTLEVIDGPAVVTEEGLIEMTGTGRVRVKTTQPGNEQYAAVDEIIEFSVAKASQAIAFEATKLTDSTFLLQASVVSGLPVAYSVQSGEGSILGDTLYTPTGSSVVVTATQEGNENYLAADPQSRTFSAQVVTSAEEPIADVVKIYPNPSPAVFRVELATSTTTTRYWVINTRGQLLQKGTFHTSDATLDLSSFATGTYVLRLQTDKNSSHYRLIKE